MPEEIKEDPKAPAAETGEPDGESKDQDGQPPTGPGEDRPTPEAQQDEPLIGGRFRRDQVEEIDRTVRYADTLTRELAARDRELESLRRLQAASAAPKETSDDEKVAVLKEKYKTGDLDETGYLDGVADIRLERKLKTQEAERRIMESMKRSDDALQTAFPAVFKPGWSQEKEEAQKFLETYKAEWGIDLTRTIDGSLRIKEHLEKTLGTRRERMAGAEQERNRLARVDRAVLGNDRGTRVDKEDKAKVELKPTLSQWYRETLTKQGVNLNDPEALKKFFKSATRETRERCLVNPDAV